MSQPIIKTRDFGVSTSVFEWKKDDKKTYTISLQRTYKKDDKYVNETINMFPEDLLRYARLLEMTYERLTAYRINTPVTAKANDEDKIPF